MVSYITITITIIYLKYTITKSYQICLLLTKLKSILQLNNNKFISKYNYKLENTMELQLFYLATRL